MFPGTPHNLSRHYIRRRQKDSPIRYSAFKNMLDSQWYDSSEIENMQMEKLGELLEHSYKTVPFYKMAMDSRGIKPDMICNREQLQLLPELTRKDLQEKKNLLISSKSYACNGVYENHTGGSTGEPVSFFQDIFYLENSLASMDFCMSLMGYSPGDRHAFLWGSDRDNKLSRTFSGFIDEYLSNRTRINVFNFKEKSILSWARNLSEWDPEFLFAYTSSAMFLAGIVKKHEIKGICPRAIQLTAETVTIDHRRTLAETFGGEIFNRYGSREAGIIAHECSKGRSMHVLSLNNLVELIPVDRQNPAVCRILVTNLNNFSMPLIRYDIGDLAEPAADPDCSCGRGFGIIGKIIGRTSDTISSPGGKFIHGEFFSHLFYNEKDVRKFQVIQDDINKLTIKLVPAQGADKRKLIDRLSKQILTSGDPDFLLDFHFQENILPQASGKYKYTISKVPVEFL